MLFFIHFQEPKLGAISRLSTWYLVLPNMYFGSCAGPEDTQTAGIGKTGICHLRSVVICLGARVAWCCSQESQLDFKPMLRQDVFEIRASDGETGSLN